MRGIGVEPLPTALIVQKQKKGGRIRASTSQNRFVRSCVVPRACRCAIQLRDLRRTASKKRADGGATEFELASGKGHSIAKGAQILETYNPHSNTAAKQAQAKRKRKWFRNEEPARSLKTPA